MVSITARTEQSAPAVIAFAVCCAGVALFSVMDAVMKGLSLAIGVYNAVLWRAVAGSLIGIAGMIALRNPWPARAVLRIHALRGVVVAFMALAFFFAITRLPLAEAIALSFIAPLVALYLAAILLGETIGRSTIVASVLGLVGVGIILSARLRGDYDIRALQGAGAMLVSALLFGWNLVIQRQQAQVASPVEVAFFQHLVMLVVFGCAAPFFAVLPAASAFPAIIGGALLAFASLMCLAWAYARAEAQKLIPVEYSAFIWSAIMGWLAFGEHVTFATLTGAAFIVAGCLIAARQRPELAHVETEAA
jgi:S-adenosylmethionine uptake transporter